MILIYAGRRPGSGFPASNVGFVAEQIQRLVIGLRPRLVIGSAAAGADLLVIEATTRCKIPVSVLLAGSRAAFRASSVADKGARWEMTFDVQLGLDGVTVDELSLDDGGEASYRKVTREITRTAERRCEAGEEIVVLGVCEARDDGAVDHTAEMMAHHEARGRLVLKLDPTRTYEQSGAAFVAMPFGTKAYPERGWKRYDCDLSYTRIMTPALIEAGYRPVRADTDAMLEVIDHTMLRHLNRAELVIADLAMLNANVMWEVGLRHAWRRSGTILMAPNWVTSPFDVKRVPLHGYDRTAGRISDKAAVAAIKHLREALADFQRVKDRQEMRVDSPVFANVGRDMPEVILPAIAPAVESATSRLLEAISLAADLRRADELVELAGRARDAGELAHSTRDLLVEQCGLALNALGRHDAARALLEPLAQADRKFEHPRLQQQCANAEIRSDGTQWLDAAHERLNGLVKASGGDSETYGLLGAVHKRRVEDALGAGRPPPAAELDASIEHYVRGLKTDPGDFYPGVNAIALLRLRGLYFRQNETDRRRARELLPVVRFAVTRERDALAENGWARLTLAELALHAQLLGESPPATPAELYAQAAPLTDHQRASARRQLRMLRHAGDPAEVLDPLLEMIG